MWDKAMNNADAELLGSLFAEDGEVMFERMESIIGRETITEVFRAAFEASDFTRWTAEYTVFEVHEQAAYVIGNFDVPVYHYDERAPVHTIGRAVWFWKRHPDGVWRISHAISARRGKTIVLEQ